MVWKYCGYPRRYCEGACASPTAAAALCLPSHQSLSRRLLGAACARPLPFRSLDWRPEPGPTRSFAQAGHARFCGHAPPASFAQKCRVRHWCVVSRSDHLAQRWQHARFVWLSYGGGFRVNSGMFANCELTRISVLERRSPSIRCFVHRARGVSRPKPFPGAVGGSRRFVGRVDENATGSVNFCLMPRFDQARRADRSYQHPGAAFRAGGRDR